MGCILKCCVVLLARLIARCMSGFQTGVDIPFEDMDRVFVLPFAL